MTLHLPLLTIAALSLLVAPAAANAGEYRATLDGNSTTNMSGSSATATATVTVDEAAQTVALELTVTGLPIDGLWDRLVAAPAGPIHLHRYAGSDLSDPNSSALAFPVPFDPSYQATTDGFTVSTGPRPYAEGAAVLRVTTSFEDFVAVLNSGQIVLNIHTDAHNAGEISGQVVAAGQIAAPLPYAEPVPTDHSAH